MDEITSPPPRPCPFCDPEGFDKGMERAQALLQKGCDALDDNRFWSGVALGCAGIFRGFGTILCHPVEAIEDLCTSDESEDAEDDGAPALPDGDTDAETECKD